MFFARYDFWIGAYWDRKARTLYLVLIPMIVLAIEMEDDNEP